MKKSLLLILVCMIFVSNTICEEFECPGCCSISLDNEIKICNCPSSCQCLTQTFCMCPSDCGCDKDGCIGK
ncbi:unnamed protein product [Brachionus calyciflorus]|uniref:Uncharacterized protein n=1 Tax=Brachionus calyciflorus TaxID=104777 RepID=A0A814QUB1_9BILA|nr:unnamed protein product [Brachionus calyciflorus]